MTTDPPIGSLALIDDSAIDQMLSKRIIERSGLVRSFKGFVSAEEALAHLRTQPMPAVDAILLDVNMPRMDGFQFLEAASAELGDDFARIVVMMLTTSLDPRDQARAKRFSAVKHYCHKPLTVQYLEELVGLLRQSGV